MVAILTSIEYNEYMKIGFTCSVFDLLHTGHIIMLEEAKSKCDYLIVGLQTHGRKDKHQPIQSVVERYLQLKACKHVDEIMPYTTEEDLNDLLSLLNIDIRIIGEEYKNKDFTGKEICHKRNIEIYYNKREHRFSSSYLRNKI